MLVMQLEAQINCQDNVSAGTGKSSDETKSTGRVSTVKELYKAHKHCLNFSVYTHGPIM